MISTIFGDLSIEEWNTFIEICNSMHLKFKDDSYWSYFYQTNVEICLHCYQGLMIWLIDICHQDLWYLIQ